MCTAVNYKLAAGYLTTTCKVLKADIYSTAYAELKHEHRIPQLMLASRGVNARRFTCEYSSTQALVLDCLEYLYVRSLTCSGSVISGSEVMQHRSAQKYTLYSDATIVICCVHMYLHVPACWFSLMTSDFFMYAPFGLTT